MKIALATAGHGHTGIHTAQSLVSVSVTRTLADACATPSRKTKPIVNKKITASQRRENRVDWAQGGRLRRQRDGMTEFYKSVNIGNHFLKKPALKSGGCNVLLLTGATRVVCVMQCIHTGIGLFDGGVRGL